MFFLVIGLVAIGWIFPPLVLFAWPLAIFLFFVWLIGSVALLFQPEPHKEAKPPQTHWMAERMVPVSPAKAVSPAKEPVGPSMGDRAVNLIRNIFE
jgi:hypothetical protein